MSQQVTYRTHDKLFNATLIIVSLGYLIDLFLYNVVRVPSLTELGVSKDDVTRIGVEILSYQVLGTLIGGFLWGVLGDKIGRKSAMIGSVLIYSLTSLGCAMVQDVTTYAWLRFFTGIGVAGEMGVGLVLIAETLKGHKRGWGIAIFAVLGLAGVALAALSAQFLDWRVCYAIGGVAGLMLLLLRSTLQESHLFQMTKAAKSQRGNLKLLFAHSELFRRYICIVFIIAANFFVTGLLITFSPEIAAAKNMLLPVKASTALLVYACCAMVGDLVAALISRILQRRVIVLALYLGLNALAVALFLSLDQPSTFEFYAVCGLLGLCNFWVMFSMTAAEQFGTNLRATAATSALNVGRATLIIMTNVFLYLKTSGYDVVTAAAYVGLGVLVIAGISLLGIRETYHADLDFQEKDSKP